MPDSLARAHLISSIRKHAIMLSGRLSDYTPLFDQIGDARYVLIGEATHGTDEFYRVRAELTKQLVEYHGFAAVAIEGDWPDTYRVNRYVRGDAAIANARSALSQFLRFPTWMWRNEVMVEFINWLRAYNDRKSNYPAKAGFYGLDLYSLNASIEAVIQYLEKIDPPAAGRAKRYYGCFDLYNSGDPQNYGYAASFGLTPSCENDVVRQLLSLRQRRFHYLQKDGLVAGEEFFCAEQNARLAVHAEAYYRSMFQTRISSWNLRDQHMVDTLYRLAEHLTNQREKRAKIVVWAHNSHIGDARATQMAGEGELNIGQLVRETQGSADCFLIGFSTYKGTVTAASQWDGLAEQKSVRPALTESYEALFHEIDIPNFLLMLRHNEELARHLDIFRLQRAIGVLYLPQTERQSHYFFSKLPEQFDAVIHIDGTRALKPLETSALWHKGEVFETYPSGF